MRKIIKGRVHQLKLKWIMVQLITGTMATLGLMSMRIAMWIATITLPMYHKHKADIAQFYVYHI